MATLPDIEQHTLGSSIPVADVAGVIAPIGANFLIRQGTIWAVQSMQNIHPQVDPNGFSDLQVENTDDATILARKAHTGAGSDEDEENEAFMSLKIGPFTTDTNIRLVIRRIVPQGSYAGLAKIVQIGRSSQS